MTRRPVRVGLTGGIGSGKSTVLQRLAERHQAVESADAVVHRLYATAGPASRAVGRLLGDAVLRADGSVDRQAVRAETFANVNDPPDVQARKDTRRLQLMATLDPFIWNGLLDHERSHPTAPWVVWEIPLLVEAGWAERVDTVVVVDCPEAVQVERVKTRNGWNDSEIAGVLARQASRQDRRSVAQDLLDGALPRPALMRQVDRLIQTWLQRYAGQPEQGA